MPNNLIPISLWALLLGLAHLTPTHAQDVEVSNQDGLLSVKANNASAIHLADVLSDELGISVVVTGDTETLVNIDIVEEPLDKALNKLSPSNMLVRAGDKADSEIIEIVLLMGEGSQTAPAGDDQYLPSGSPAEDIAPEVPVAADVGSQPVDGQALRDPNRAQLVRDAAGAAANDAGLPPEEPPVDYSADGVPIDPNTGMPVEQQQQ